MLQFSRVVYLSPSKQLAPTSAKHRNLSEKLLSSERKDRPVSVNIPIVSLDSSNPIYARLKEQSRGIEQSRFDTFDLFSLRADLEIIFTAYEKSRSDAINLAKQYLAPTLGVDTAKYDDAYFKELARMQEIIETEGKLFRQTISAPGFYGHTNGTTVEHLHWSCSLVE